MKRRDVLAGFGAMAFAWPFAARAQRSGEMRHVGVLVGLAPGAEDPVAEGFMRAFREAMRQAGWIEGTNVRVDYRFGGTLADLSRTDASATELVALAPDVIYAQGLPAALALRKKTRTIPVVFTQVADPVGFGLADSLKHPGGNVTGFVVWDLSIGGKWMQLLRELVPDLSHAGVLYNPDTAPYAGPIVEAVKGAAGPVEVIECHTRNDAEVEAQLTMLRQKPRGGVIVIPEPFANAHREQIIVLSNRIGVPAVNSVLTAADRGALLSYTVVLEELISRPVSYIDRILKGQSPAELPVQAPTKYELAINLKTAKALGVSVPPTLSAVADKIIE